MTVGPHDLGVRAREFHTQLVVRFRRNEARIERQVLLGNDVNVVA
jgi:hypothetical protein